MKTVGIVLSGGGARGIAHLGFLKALDELQIKVSGISGVSAGAVVGALYAAGHSPETMLEIVKGQSNFGITDIAWLRKGLFSMDGISQKLNELIAGDDFKYLDIPLYITTTDIVHGRPVVFSNGPLFDPIIASSAVPVIFEPVLFQGYKLLDGGILDNLPVAPLAGKYDVLIGSHVNKLFDGETDIQMGRISLLDQCFHLAITSIIERNASVCNVFIEPLLMGFAAFDITRADELFERGYAATMAQKEKILKVTGG